MPQTIRVWRSHRTQDLSAGTFILLVIQAAAWTCYGVLLGNAPLFWTNSTVLLLALAILAAKARYG